MTELLRRPAIVIGTGDWFLRTVAHMRKAGIEPVIVVGNRSAQEGRKFLDDDKVKLFETKYVQRHELLDEVAKKPLESGSLGIVLSKPNDHQPDALLVSELPVAGAYVEKPFASFLYESEVMVKRFRQVAPQLVGGDHYLAGKSQALEWLKGLRHVPKEQVASIDKTPLDELFGALERIGHITRVTGRIVEGGKDPRGDIKGREWLEDPSQGGVISDLASHLIAVGSRIEIWGNTPRLLDVRGEVYDSQAARWRHMHRRGPEPLAERYASLTYQGAGGLPIELTVGKIGDRSGITIGKSMKIEGALGSAFVDFAKNHVHVNLHDGTVFGTILVGEPYTLLWDHFRRAVEGRAPNNVKEVVTAVAMVQEASIIYRKQDTDRVQPHLQEILSMLPQLQRPSLPLGA